MVLIFSTPYNRVIAMEAMTGREYWAFDPEPWKGYGQPSNGTGLVHRGVATWTDGKERRVFINSRWRLFALDAKTGKELLRKELGRRATATPMTYRTAAGTQFVVIATGTGNNAALLAMKVAPAR